MEIYAQTHRKSDYIKKETDLPELLLAFGTHTENKEKTDWSHKTRVLHDTKFDEKIKCFIGVSGQWMVGGGSKWLNSLDYLHLRFYQNQAKPNIKEIYELCEAFNNRVQHKLTDIFPPFDFERVQALDKKTVPQNTADPKAVAEDWKRITAKWTMINDDIYTQQHMKYAYKLKDENGNMRGVEIKDLQHDTKHKIKGSEAYPCYFLQGMPTQKMVITENALRNIAYSEIEKMNGRNDEACHVATQGQPTHKTLDTIAFLAKKYGCKEIILAMDWDEKGQQFNEKIKEHLIKNYIDADKIKILQKPTEQDFETVLGKRTWQVRVAQSATKDLEDVQAVTKVDYEEKQRLAKEALKTQINEIEINKALQELQQSQSTSTYKKDLGL